MTKNNPLDSPHFFFRACKQFIPLIFALILLGGLFHQGEVLAAPDPSRVIIVDRNLQILSIISNTKEDVRPEVCLESRDGLNLPYTDSIETQYLSLKPALNFSKTGVVYERDVRAPIAVFKMLFSLFAKLLHFPW